MPDRRDAEGRANRVLVREHDRRRQPGRRASCGSVRITYHFSRYRPSKRVGTQHSLRFNAY